MLFKGRGSWGRTCDPTTVDVTHGHAKAMQGTNTEGLDRRGYPLRHDEGMSRARRGRLI